MWIENETLVFLVAQELRVLGRHAVENAGCWGDCLVEARIVGNQEMRMAYRDQFSHPHEIDGGRALTGPVVSHHTLLLDGLVGADSDLLSAARLVASDLFQAFGSPEVRHVTPDGRLRKNYFRGDTRELFRLAEARGVELTDEAVPGE